MHPLHGKHGSMSLSVEAVNLLCLLTVEASFLELCATVMHSIDTIMDGQAIHCIYSAGKAICSTEKNGLLYPQNTVGRY